LHFALGSAQEERPVRRPTRKSHSKAEEKKPRQDLALVAFHFSQDAFLQLNRVLIEHEAPPTEAEPVTFFTIVESIISPCLPQEFMRTILPGPLAKLLVNTVIVWTFLGLLPSNSPPGSDPKTCVM
jgi:hypothetical protein